MSADPMPAAEDGAARRDALVERLFGAAIGAFDLCGVYLGDRLGLYRALAEHGPASPAELARAAGIDERYAREWLEQQAASAILDVVDGDGEGEQRFALPAGHAEALLDEESLSYIAPFGRLLVACLRPIDALLEAYRGGGGVPYADYGADLHEGQAAFTRPLFSRLLAQEWLPAVPEIDERLRADPPARVADLACGGGISSIAIARGYPAVHVDGIDLDEASIELARRHLAGSGVEERVRFDVRDAADPALAHRYDLVTVFEALHDMSYPVEVLGAARELLAPGGVVLVGDERTAESFGAPADELERLYYGFSILHCLPVGMVGDGAVGTGTVMRPATVESYARQAGFGGVEIAPIENDFWRFYLLRP
jgi:2-polyprenyl-3-methyl-5-hydroxy-6-metoxy-1,4-benzoquinol methylase